MSWMNEWVLYVNEVHVNCKFLAVFDFFAPDINRYI